MASRELASGVLLVDASLPPAQEGLRLAAPQVEDAVRGGC